MSEVTQFSDFDSIYTHAFSWCIEKNTVDAKNAKNSNLFVEIDRIMQNINGRFSNGIVVGPEFSRMMAEILLQWIDCEVKRALEIQNIVYGIDYKIYRSAHQNNFNRFKSILQKSEITHRPS